MQFLRQSVLMVTSNAGFTNSLCRLKSGDLSELRGLVTNKRTRHDCVKSTTKTFVYVEMSPIITANMKSKWSVVGIFTQGLLTHLRGHGTLTRGTRATFINGN